MPELINRIPRIKNIYASFIINVLIRKSNKIEREYLIENYNFISSMI